MDSHEIGTLDLASLERFRTELIEAGFEPQRGDQRVWIGPIADALKDLTTATTMRVEFRDGWPFQHPRLFVEGIDRRHVNAAGEVCLWRSGGPGGEWLNLHGYMQRIEEWARRARVGFQVEDFALDAHLSFGRIRAGTIATVDLDKLGLDGASGKIGVISGTWEERTPVLKISPGRDGAIEGRWYHVGKVDVSPRDLESVRALLSTNQAKNFDRRHRAVAVHGQSRLFLLVWEREFGREGLLLITERSGAEVITDAIELAPTDMAVLKLRAGPDVDALAIKRLVVFGLGAVGSNVALRLAEAGVGGLALVDDARLRPGDIVRHAAGSWAVGNRKITAVRFLMNTRAPWTEVDTIDKAPWHPEVICGLIAGVDLVVDATGEQSFTNQLSLICEQNSIGVVSAALYREGSIARVRRQALSGDAAIYKRADHPEYPTIPRGNERLTFEPGCSSPVNNASPVAVAAIAAVTAQVVIDVLTDRRRYPDEIVEVYSPLDVAPFNNLGRVGR